MTAMREPWPSFVEEDIFLLASIHCPVKARFFIENLVPYYDMLDLWATVWGGKPGELEDEEGIVSLLPFP